MNAPYAILAFVTGALLGVSVTGTILKIKYAKDLEREVDSVIESFSAAPRVIFKDKKDEVEEHVESSTVSGDAPKLSLVNDEGTDIAQGFYYSPENDADKFKPQVKKYYDVHGNELVVNDDGVYEEEYEEELPELTEDDAFAYEEPYSISPDEVEPLIEEGYSVLNWTVYQGCDDSKLVADENDELVDHAEIERTIGVGVECLGEYEPDIAHICNDRLRCVIELTEDLRNYSDIMKAMPFINQ